MSSYLFHLVHPFMDLDITAGFPSIFSRAYHSHLSQHVSDFEPHTSSFSSSSPVPSCVLPQFHPLMVRHADHPQQQITARINNNTSAANATTSGSNSNSNSTGLSFENITPSAEAAAVAMQQVLTNISAASGGNEEREPPVDNTLGGAQRMRGKSSVLKDPLSDDYTVIESLHL